MGVIVSKGSRRRDFFANVASSHADVRKADLTEPAPPVLPERNLPAGRSNPRAAFKPTPKIDTPEALRRALEQERRRVAPFLRQLAPAVEATRIVAPLVAFDWRMETEADRRDFGATLAGAGDWQRVGIAPLLVTCFRADRWTPILTTGSGGGNLVVPTAWSVALAAAEKRDGAGVWRLCQVALAGRTATNPVAALFARRLVEGRGN